MSRISRGMKGRGQALKRHSSRKVTTQHGHVVSRPQVEWDRSKNARQVRGDSQTFLKHFYSMVLTWVLTYIFLNGSAGLDSIISK